MNSLDAFVMRLCEAGSPVEYLHYIGARHDTRGVGFEEAASWMEVLANGAEAPSNCAEVHGHLSYVLAHQGHFLTKTLRSLRTKPVVSSACTWRGALRSAHLQRHIG